MRSVFFISLMNGMPWGGSEELWYRAAIYALEKGHKTGVALYHWPGKKEKIRALIDAGAEIFWIPNNGRTKNNLLEKIRYKFTKASIPSFIKKLPLADYDKVIISQGGYEVFTSAWKELYKELDDYTLVFHNYNKEDSFSSSQATALKKWIAKANNNLFAAGRMITHLEQKLGINIQKKDLLINPTSFPPPLQTTPYPALADEEFIFVIIAALETDRKNQHQVITALSSPKWKERNWNLELYGEGRDQKMLEELIRENALENKVFLKGHTNNIQQVLERSHLVLQLTRMDAMPLAVIEAMAMSRPLVVSDLGDMPLWVKNGENGWVCCEPDTMNIEKMLDEAWKKKDLWPSMGSRSYEIFREKFPGSVEMNFLQQAGL
jgi:glycosyltransferase involved in cell wall biosynthesis